MKLALLGATGRTGAQVLRRALARGCTVSALVRDPGRLAAAPGLRLVVGGATDIDAVEATVDGAEAVIVTVNAMTNHPGLTFHRDAARTVARALARVNPGARLILQTSASHGLAGFERHAGGFMAGFMAFMLDHVIADHRAAEEVLRAESAWLRFTVFCPPRILDAPAVGGLTLAEDGFPAGNFTVTYADMGALLLAAAASDAHLGRVVGVNGSVAVRNSRRTAPPVSLLWDNIRRKLLRLGREA